MKNEFRLGRMFRCLSVFQCLEHSSSKMCRCTHVINRGRDISLTHITLISPFAKDFQSWIRKWHGLSKQLEHAWTENKKDSVNLFSRPFFRMLDKVWILRFDIKRVGGLKCLRRGLLIFHVGFSCFFFLRRKRNENYKANIYSDEWFFIKYKLMISFYFLLFN